METTGQQPGKIHEAIVAVMGEIGTIEKTRRNAQQNFMFRGVGDAMAACQPLFVKHKMYIRPLKVSADHTRDNVGKDGKPHGIHSRQTIVYRATSAEDGSYIDSEATGEAIDYGDKCAGKVMSVSFKFLIFQMFCIPDYNPDNDPDAHSPQAGGGGDGNGQAGGSQRPARAPSAAPKSATSPAAPGSNGPMKTLVGILNRKGYDAPAKVLSWMSNQLKRKIAATKEVKPDEIAKLTSLANSIPEPGTGPQE